MGVVVLNKWMNNASSLLFSAIGKRHQRLPLLSQIVGHRNLLNNILFFVQKPFRCLLARARNCGKLQLCSQLKMMQFLSRARARLASDISCTVVTLTSSWLKLIKLWGWSWIVAIVSLQRISLTDANGQLIDCSYQVIESGDWCLNCTPGRYGRKCHS